MAAKLEKSGRIAILRLCRPDRANALDGRLLQEIAEIQESLRGDRGISALITIGEGKGFCAGSDLEELGRLPVQEAVASQRFEGRVCRDFLSLPQAAIAAVHGYALGGGLFLAAYHDFRIIAADARLGFPEVKLGWNPTFGMGRLTRLVGATVATRWLMSGAEFTAAEAERERLATSVVATDDGVLRQARNLAGQLTALPAGGLAAVKQALWQENCAELESADSFEAEIFGRYITSPEAQASLRSYVSANRNRDPNR